ncbi:bifunctional 2-polyprenyl-6-hydroxyphenol methylase/3-demethylubiquinol 3-O-methyltransferase UbiG [Pelagibacteraceae bacterium]|nr:bifunctional 2-polyprenyl-6-hydroxyphenol methylase/3-demethylubiquinol 3-O-methyltransferase UbiG [Pelagibacteraceae bacterium]
MNIKSKNQEFELFNQLSDEWWNENGKFKILHQIKRHRMTYILEQINNRKIKNLKILDVGCGGGIICEPLARLGARVTGIDFAPNNIKAAKLHSKKNKLKINYIHKDIEKFKLDKKFDLILMFEVLEHLDNWKNTIKNIKKNLNQNGIIIISTINRNLFSKLFAIDIAENILQWIPKGTHDYNKLIKPKELENALSKENFHFNNIKGLVFDPFNREWKLSKNHMINYFCSASLIN